MPRANIIFPLAYFPRATRAWAERGGRFLSVEIRRGGVLPFLTMVERKYVEEMNYLLKSYFGPIFIEEMS